MCSVANCDQPIRSRGVCNRHYKQMRQDGRLPSLTVAEKFWAKVEKTHQHWIWMGARDTSGYGRFRLNGRVLPAHRVAYEWVIGPVPDGLYLDHVCRVRECVNPAHLEPVTREVNFGRAPKPNAWQQRAAWTHCIHGHELSGRNLILRPEGGRRCRACSYESVKRYVARRGATG